MDITFLKETIVLKPKTCNISCYKPHYVETLDIYEVPYIDEDNNQALERIRFYTKQCFHTLKEAINCYKWEVKRAAK